MGFRTVVVAVLLCVAQPATAEPANEPDAPPARAHRLRLADEWRRFGIVDYGATIAVYGAYGAVYWGVSRPTEPSWTSAALFDEPVRDTLVADTKDGRRDARVASDVTTHALQAWVVGVDGIVVPMVDDWNWRVSWHMTTVNLQAMGLVGLLTLSGKLAFARERPVEPACQEDFDHDYDCGGGANTGFPSGHTSSSFVAAGLICAHHANLPLYGSPLADALACGVALGTATSSGIFRIVGDRHWSTDVLAGAALGFAGGFVLPSLVYYRGEPELDDTSASLVRWSVAPMASPAFAGAGAFGVF